jgi:hypothetical protein
MTFDYRIADLIVNKPYAAQVDYLADLAACTCDECGSTGESLSRVHELGHFWVCDTCYDAIGAMIDAADTDERAAAMLAARKPVTIETEYHYSAPAPRAIAAGEDCPF